MAVKKQTIKQTTRKPQLIKYAMSIKQKITIIVSGGIVQDIIHENCPDLEIVVHDYDQIVEEEKTCIDNKGKSYYPIHFN